MATAMQIVQSSTASSTGTQAPSTSAPVLDFACLFTHDLRRKQKRWQDGRLKYHTFNRRVMVYDERGNFVGDAHWSEDYDLGDGDELQLERGGVIAQVGECTGRRDQDLSELIDKRAQEKAQRQSAALARRQPTREPTTPRGPTFASYVASTTGEGGVGGNAAAAASASHFQLRHQPLHRLIGTPSGHYGRASIPTESPYEQRRQQSDASPLQDDANHPAKRRKRDISPPSKSGYAQSLFGASLTLSGRPMSSAPIRRKLTKPIPPRQDDPCPDNFDRSNPDAGIDSVISAPKVSVVKDKERDMSPSRGRKSEPHRASSPIMVENNPNPQRLLGASHVGAPGPPNPRNVNSKLDNKKRGPLESMPVNKGRGSMRSANQLIHSDASKRQMLSSKLEEAVQRQEREKSSETRRPKLPQVINPKEIPHSDQPVTDSVPSNQTSTGSDGNKPAATEEPRTELRIRPRKKPGLLMLSAKLPGTKLGSNSKEDLRDTPPLAVLEETNNQKRKEKRRASNDLMNQHSGNREKSRRRSCSKQHAVNPNIAPTEDVLLLDEDQTESRESRPSRQKSPENVPHRDTVSKTHEKGKKKKKDASHPALITDGQNIEATLSNDSFEMAEMVVPRKELRRIPGNVPVSEDEDAPEVDAPNSPGPKKRRSKRVQNRQRTPEELDLPEEADEIEEAPAPRVARIKRGIRSRELIGFSFPDEDDGQDHAALEISTSVLSVVQPHQPQELQDPRPMATLGAEKSPNADSEESHRALVQSSCSRDTTLTNLLDCKGLEISRQTKTDPSEQDYEGRSPPSGLMMTGDPDQDLEKLQGDPLSKPRLSLEPPQIPEPPQRQSFHSDPGAQQSTPTDITSAVLQPSDSDPNRLQDSAQSGRSKSEINVQQATEPEAREILPKIIGARKIINPASRGKKAAKPSDAAGQLPICPLPPEVRTIGPVIQVPAKRLNKPSNQGSEIATPLPGFSRANGGPWSREAYDLFEFQRPT